jgi:hypothetical protein
VGKGRLKERCGSESQTNLFSFKKSPKTECGLDSRIYGILLKIYVSEHRGKQITVLKFNYHTPCFPPVQCKTAQTLPSAVATAHNMHQMSPPLPRLYCPKMPRDPELNPRSVNVGYVAAIVALTKGLLPFRFSLVSTITRSLLRHVTCTAHYVKAPVFQRKCAMENSRAYPCCSMQNDSGHVRDNAMGRSVYWKGNSCPIKQ